jgi:hypothetical protein
LFCIGLSPLGVPISLFTVNCWVTGEVSIDIDRRIATLLADNT